MLNLCTIKIVNVKNNFKYTQHSISIKYKNSKYLIFKRFEKRNLPVIFI